MTDEAAVAGLTFVVADLHGRFDLLEAALHAITTHAARREGGARTIVFLGDYIDRGPAAREVLARLSAGPADGWRWICLKGNHEAMMTLALRNPDRLDWWMGNGGDTTIASYRDHHAVIAAHLAWVEALPSMHLDRHRVYVHAGVDPGRPLAQQEDKILLWKRYPPEFADGYGALHVVHGHDPHADGPLLHHGRSDLDTYAWVTGRLVIGVFDDELAGGPFETIEVNAPPVRGDRSTAV